MAAEVVQQCRIAIKNLKDVSSGTKGLADPDVDESAEVVWRDTEARSFAAVVDGIQKLAASGIPIDELVDMIPGATQQKIQSIKDSLRRSQVNGLVQALQGPVQPNLGTLPNPPAEVGMPAQVDAVTK